LTLVGYLLSAEAGVAAGTTPPLPSCGASDRPATARATWQWQRTILDPGWRLGRDYVPANLVPVARAGFRSDDRVRRVVLADLAALRRAAEAAGAAVEVLSAYRSYEAQAALFAAKAAELGTELASLYVARPGHSEHQLGTTLDFVGRGETGLSVHWASTPAGRWMKGNAWRYGFVMSYPEGKRAVTCYAYEPWHYRYLGRDLAARIHASGLTTREYLWVLEHEASTPAAGSELPPRLQRLVAV
jgi:D-alanyl-D-alanine carboxypeptidase